jgi:thiamine-monophosphate kinase
MDTSDGLADALVQIGRASGKGLLIDLEKLPIDAQTVAVSSIAGTDPLDWALYGGEDYELVACIPQVIWHDWSVDNPFKMIGSVNDSGKIELLNGEMTRELNLSKCFEQLNF